MPADPCKPYLISSAGKQTERDPGPWRDADKRQFVALDRRRAVLGGFWTFAKVYVCNRGGERPIWSLTLFLQANELAIGGNPMI